MIEALMSFDPSNRPSAEEIIKATEMILEAKAQNLDPNSFEAKPLVSELDNRNQYMLISKYQTA